MKDKPYTMDKPKLGRAIIINNVQREMPGSEKDVKALQAVYKMIGFDVEVHNNCSSQVCSTKHFKYYRPRYPEGTSPITV